MFIIDVIVKGFVLDYIILRAVSSFWHEGGRILETLLNNEIQYNNTTINYDLRARTYNWIKAYDSVNNVIGIIKVDFMAEWLDCIVLH